MPLECIGCHAVTVIPLVCLLQLAPMVLKQSQAVVALECVGEP